MGDLRLHVFHDRRRVSALTPRPMTTAGLGLPKRRRRRRATADENPAKSDPAAASFHKTQPASRRTIVSRGVPTVEQETGAVRRQRSDDTLPAPPTTYETRDEPFKAVCTGDRRRRPSSKLVTGARRTQQMHLCAVHAVKQHSRVSNTSLQAAGRNKAENRSD